MRQLVKERRAASRTDRAEPTRRGVLSPIIVTGCVIASLLLLLLMILTVSDVILRSVHGAGVKATLTYVTLLMAASAALALPMAELSKTHVRTPVLTARLAPGPRRWIRVVGLVVSIMFVALATYSTGDSAITAFSVGERTAGLEQLPLWPSKAALALGFLLLLLQLLRELKTEVFRRNSPAPKEGEGPWTPI